MMLLDGYQKVYQDIMQLNDYDHPDPKAKQK